MYPVSASIKGYNCNQPTGSVCRPDKHSAIRQLSHRITRIRHHYDPA
ncbi:hypothetical protein HMPREF0208_02162 [Citrobacter koseri]|nr:hypothetical protein HMPREF0208_02162 [Citrobacter koseri]